MGNLIGVKKYPREKGKESEEERKRFKLIQGFIFPYLAQNRKKGFTNTFLVVVRD